MLLFLYRDAIPLTLYFIYKLFSFNGSWTNWLSGYNCDLQADCSNLELHILVGMKRLEVKEQSLCNFNSVMKGNICCFSFNFFILFLNVIANFAEYKSMHDSFRTSEYYSRNVCLRVCPSAFMIFLSQTCYS